MAGAVAGQPASTRLSSYISLGVIAKEFPIEAVRRVLAATGTASERECDLPAHVMVHCAIALSLHMSASTREVLRCLLEGLWGAEAVRVAGRSSISQARSRLGKAPRLDQFALEGGKEALAQRVVPRVRLGRPALIETCFKPLENLVRTAGLEPA